MDCPRLSLAVGKPTQNAYIESFNGKFRDEYPKEHWFTDLHHARNLISKWRKDYNENWPHSALAYMTPAELAAYHRDHKLTEKPNKPTDYELDFTK